MEFSMSVPLKLSRHPVNVFKNVVKNDSETEKWDFWTLSHQDYMMP